VTRSGPKFLLIRPDIVGPKVFTWSEPIQIRYLGFLEIAVLMIGFGQIEVQLTSQDSEKSKVE
jgi:hypothetical protein